MTDAYGWNMAKSKMSRFKLQRDAYADVYEMNLSVINTCWNKYLFTEIFEVNLNCSQYSGNNKSRKETTITIKVFTH